VAEGDSSVRSLISRSLISSVPPDPPKPDPKSKVDRPAAQFSPAVLTLTRIPTPAHYPLLERGFHFINEWRYER
jgi:hypothetical protein